MKIKKLKLKNIFIFEDLNLKFKDGLNIIEINNKEINLKLMKILYAMYENDKHIGKINFDLSYRKPIVRPGLQREGGGAVWAEIPRGPEMDSSVTAVLGPADPKPSPHRPGG